VSRYQKGKTRKVKTNLDLLEQEIMSGSGIYLQGYYASLHLIPDNHANIPPLRSLNKSSTTQKWKDTKYKKIQ